VVVVRILSRPLVIIFTFTTNLRRCE